MIARQADRWRQADLGKSSCLYLCTYVVGSTIAISLIPASSHSALSSLLAFLSCAHSGRETDLFSAPLSCSCCAAEVLAPDDVISQACLPRYFPDNDGFLLVRD